MRHVLSFVAVAWLLVGRIPRLVASLLRGVPDMCCPLSVADGTLNPQPASTHRVTRRRWGIGRATKSVCYRTRALTRAVLLPRERREAKALLLHLVSYVHRVG